MTKYGCRSCFKDEVNKNEIYIFILPPEGNYLNQRFIVCENLCTNLKKINQDFCLNEILAA